ncbi:tetraacyldisaccharide 4'-kinase [Mucilaginibacter terrae]|uniref:Tetraacyldisaccharide 4'-kinase n=1 Tax=Mucilaginibacter terrae TaxID=1955052 RepID=A0ABU3GYF3_9SPHI|nr:tetraacyldisaccharide 4'-kinase [Mucilaginibacter terrae]MDT3404805.1 tetraacyldisaccharide 4'-kinase [Mucilaginibacter terrae]
MKYLRWLLFPLSLLYGLVVLMRNWFYDSGLFKSRSFNLPVIVIGNLEVGGAGKSPMAEYLVRLLKSDLKLATLSRGYGRQTKGYLTATSASTATQIGDEPAQFKQKFPDVTVAVCEKRADGIEQLAADHDLIILDDAFQHRAVTPGLSILLFDFNRLADSKLLLPAGNLREPFIGRYRADVFVVSKCPSNLSAQQQQQALQILKPLNYEQVYFTAIDYLPLQDMSGSPVGLMPDADTTVFLLTGIANTQPLLTYINEHSLNVIHHNYADHHQFTLKNIGKLANDFNSCTAAKKVIITTEKDAQRLHEPALQPLVQKLPIWVLPIGIKFLNEEGKNQFNKTIHNYVRQYTTHH